MEREPGKAGGAVKGQCKFGPLMKNEERESWVEASYTIMQSKGILARLSGRLLVV